MGMQHHPVQRTTTIPPPPAPVWARRLAIEIGIREAEQCASLPGWMLRLREMLTGEPRPTGLADPELEMLRAEAACRAADAHWTVADLERFLTGATQR